ncbi:transcription-repair coupling factor [Paracoccaceae bacterium]|nr:transcription-repair coupling factor [Paracoccaceae bacterium]
MINNLLKMGGAPEGYDAALIVKEFEKSGAHLLHIARDDKRMAAVKDALNFFAPDIPIKIFPSWDCLPYDRISPNSEISSDRLSLLTDLAQNLSSKLIILTTVNAVTQRIPNRSVLSSATFKAEVGKNIDINQLYSFLSKMGFSKASTVSEPGDYAVRGGIIDIFAPGELGAVRLDLFGDVLDGIRQFDPISQRTVSKMSNIRLSPVSEVIFDEASISRFRQNYRKEFGASHSKDVLYESVSAGNKYQGVEHWLPFFHEKLETIFDYLPESIVTLDDNIDAAQTLRWEVISDQFQSRKENLDQKSKLDSVYKPIEPALLYLNESDWKFALSSRAVLQFSPFPQIPSPNVKDAGSRIGKNFSIERQADNINIFNALSSFIKSEMETKPVIIASYTDGARERLKGLLEDEGLDGANLIQNINQVDKTGLFLVVWSLEQGFKTDKFTVISEQDVLGERLIRQSSKRRRAENFLTEATSLIPGDLVVHVDHGIGKYHNLEVISAAEALHECLVLEYAENARLYLPVENIELLSKYGQEFGLLDKLGGAAWQAKKAKLKQRIKDIAERLIRVAAERELRTAPIFEPPPGVWDAFSAKFPYQETDDQMNAITDVIGDLTSGRPMDRLVCGDVGFGKTEIAMRAAFLASIAGYQVAVIAPTTLLVRQHTKSFLDRFRGLPVEIRQLSRFVSKKEAEKTRNEIQSGEVDIVVGTHALLAQSINFKNLGLLIIDEEQHFGVQHKERLKQLRSDIHVLTLTATPIPRTLQLSLAGVRDLSIIATPPVDRLAIRTFISEFDTITVREALLRERFRGGQSFYVVPRVADLEEIELFLQDHVPEISYVIAHGQLPTGELDNRMNSFYDGKYDVLLATTIVESGLDIPSANTIVVHRAEMFGLAQLYQIRGRVGRSKLRAYAYMTTKARANMTAASEKRLKVLSSLDALGAGFSLASQDLDIRGAGNLLGEEQSGQIRDVGYELYQSMLEETISKIRGGQIDVLTSMDNQWSPQINLGVSVLIPETYVADLDVRLGLYRRLSNLSKKVEFEGFAAELIDRFGKLPPEVNTLLLVVRIKSVCKKAGIAKLDGGPKGATVQFHNDKFISPQGLVEFIKKQNGLAKVKDNKLIIKRDWKKNSDKFKGAFAIARDLAEVAASHEKNAATKT